MTTTPSAAGGGGHTPGPWDNDKSIGISGQHHYGLNLCFVNTNDDARRDECRANARLIAAAPDLLAALARLSVSYARLKPPGSPRSDAEKQADAAFAKATGASQ